MATLSVAPTVNSTDNQKKNRIQVSNTKKPLFFYVNLAKVINPALSLSLSILVLLIDLLVSMLHFFDLFDIYLHIIVRYSETWFLAKDD